MGNSKLKVGMTSTAIALACAGAAYAYLKYKYRQIDAVDALNYLDIEVVNTEIFCDVVVQELRKRSTLHRAVGFDCEWVTEHGKRQPVALVQLSTFDGFCGLFRLNLMKDMPISLKALLEDETIYKVGVAPYDDGKYLQQDYSVQMKSTLDVRHLAVLCGHCPGGLAAMAKALLHVILDKSWRIRCSNWAAPSLTARQVAYAAADAHLGIRLFVDLVQQYHSGPTSWFKSKSGIWQNLDDLCLKYVDLKFKNNTKSKSKKDTLTRDKEEKGMDVISKRYAPLTRQKPLYHNCFLQAPDGETLCTCDFRKASWYVEKQLADIVQEQPLTVRLRFEPAGRSVGDVGRYYQLTKENCCVVCGRSDSYIRKNVVPREYRKYFPDIMKERSSHDVLLLCVHCHQVSNMRDQAVRGRLAALCNAPYQEPKFTENQDCKKIRSAARALLYQARKHNLPEERRKNLENIILQHYPERDEITVDLLKEASEIQVIFENADYESHGQKVVEYYLEQDGGLLGLEELWREHFLTSMRPQHMPELWSVKHNEERLRVRLNEGRLTEEDLKLIGLTRWL